MEPNVVDHTYFKLWILLNQIIRVWNIKGLQHRVLKILGFKYLILLQRLNSFDWVLHLEISQSLMIIQLLTHYTILKSLIKQLCDISRCNTQSNLSKIPSPARLIPRFTTQSFWLPYRKSQYLWNLYFVLIHWRKKSKNAQSLRITLHLFIIANSFKHWQII